MSKNTKKALRGRFWSVARPLKNWLVRKLQRPRVGETDFGDLRRLSPISKVWGADRGLPIDRYYIEQFLEEYSNDICRHVLEIGSDTYTRRFGGERVEKCDVLHVDQELPGVTIVDDLTKGAEIASDTFDCVVFTQTLQFIYDYGATVSTLHRILKLGGVLLATFPGISKISPEDKDRFGHYWGFTTCSTKSIFEKQFERDELRIQSVGNILTTTAFLHGLSAQELTKNELEYFDPGFELLITVRARKTRR